MLGNMTRCSPSYTLMKNRPSVITEFQKKMIKQILWINFILNLPSPATAFGVYTTNDNKLQRCILSRRYLRHVHQ